MFAMLPHSKSKSCRKYSFLIPILIGLLEYHCLGLQAFMVSGLGEVKALGFGVAGVQVMV